MITRRSFLGFFGMGAAVAALPVVAKPMFDPSKIAEALFPLPEKVWTLEATAAPSGMAILRAADITIGVDDYLKRYYQPIVPGTRMSSAELNQRFESVYSELYKRTS